MNTTSLIHFDTLHVLFRLFHLDYAAKNVRSFLSQHLVSKLCTEFARITFQFLRTIVAEIFNELINVTPNTNMETNLLPSK